METSDDGTGGENCTVSVYVAMSLDGFIAGPGDDLSWLEGSGEGSADSRPSGETGSGQEGEGGASGALHFEEFIADVGVLLMGRRTYDVVRGLDGPWPYGDLPVLVATRRPLDEDAPGTVRGVSGPIRELLEESRRMATGRRIYIDGGELIRQAAEEDLIDELIITVAPLALGRGRPLFAGMGRKYEMEFLDHQGYPGGMVQVRARPRSTPE